MAKSRENIALEWTRDELVETLGSARRALEAYADAMDDGAGASGADLEGCVTAVHQVHGVLVMLELGSAATLAAHLEAVARGLAAGSIADPAGAAECLMQGLLELPDYLDAQRSGLGDTIVPLLPVLNELRLHLRQPPLAAPHVSLAFAAAPSTAALQRFAAVDGLDKVRKVRAVYQQVLLSVLKGGIARSAIETLQKVALGMQRLCEGTPPAVLWQTFDEYLKALDQSLDRQPGSLGAEAVKLLRRMDSELRTLSQEGTEALARPVSMELLQQLASAALARGYTSEFLAHLQQALSATDMSEALTSSGRRALASAAAALRDDLAGIRDRVDLLLRGATGEGGETAGREALVMPLKQISSTMSLLGLESSRSLIVEQLEVLAGGEVDVVALESMAYALAQVDQNLASLSQGGKGDAELILDSAQQAVLAEARHGLEILKQAIVDYVSSQWDVRHLQQLPESLAGIASALRMVPLPEAATLVDRCIAYINGELLAGHVPDWRELDRFAGAVSGADYYLERLAGPSAAGAEKILEYAERSLAALTADTGMARVPVPPQELPPQALSSGGPQLVAATTIEAEAARPEPDSALAQGEPELPAQSLGVANEADFVRQPDAVLETAASFEIESVTSPEPAAVLPAATELAAAPAPESEPDRVPSRMLGHEIGPEIVPDWVSEVPEWSSVGPAEAPQAMQPEDTGALAERAAEPAEWLAAEVEPAIAHEAVPDVTIELELPLAPAEQLSPGVAEARARLATLEDVFEVDEEILDVFLEEVDEVLATIQAQLPPWQRDLAEGQHAVELRRAFHTLKGSGRLVGAKIFGELAWSIEQMLNRVIDGTIAATPELATLVGAARRVALDLRTDFAGRQQPSLDAAAEIVARAERFAAGELEQETLVPAVAAAAPEEPASATPTAAAEPVDTGSLFRDEAFEYLAILAAAREASGYRIDETVARALHTLAGSAAMVGVTVVAELARAALDLVQALLGSRETVRVTGPTATLFGEVIQALESDLLALSTDRPLAQHSDLIVATDRLRMATPGSPLIPALLALPGLDALLGAQLFLQDWQGIGPDPVRCAALRESLQEVLDLADAPEHAPLAELAGALLAALGRMDGAGLDESSARALLAGYERLLGQIDALAAGQPLRPAPEAVAALAALETARRAPPETLLPAESVEAVELIELLEPVAWVESTPAQEPELPQVPVAAELPEPLVAAAPAEAPRVVEPLPVAVGRDIDREEVDPELVGIFLEEADELLDQIDQSVQACVAMTEPQAAIEALLRALHTLKGGARLAGLPAAGDAAHEFESWLVELRDSGAGFDGLALARLHDHYDGLARLIAAFGATPATLETAPAEVSEIEPDRTFWAASEGVPEGTAETTPEPALTAVGAEALAEEPSLPPESPVPGEATASEEREPVPTPLGPPFAVAAPAGGPDARGDRRTSEEVVRVRAALLDQLVNLAGESSIIRGRVQQGLSEFGGALDEMEMTIQRLREQLRRLEIETEAQILFRRERPDSPGYEDFDPLELDRYSQLQQLSRSLSESASDMLDLKETLRLRAGETEALLVQQSRVNTQLQEGLMRSRMVPFARLLPRLRRTVRQVAQDLGKSVELLAFNVEGELDRSLLDRMIAPLEHMLRNAVDHGIERPEVRRASGKPETGQIELRLAREAGDVVIEIRDDGAGIDVERVKSKALKQGLMAADADLTDDEICQFVFAPGFSTARSVTQISGRGVGMDVAHSEVKQLGGSIGLTSEPGRGTRFLVRVPFTVSVNRALMVSVGEDLYAVPLNTIEGIVLVRADELEGLSEPGSGRFEYAGVAYQVRHLGEYLGRPARAGVTSGSVPVVLVRSGEVAVAVQVDGVQGSREIVVKGLGPQFAGVAGISGATILGDGGVVVILDLPALVRGRREGAVVERKRSASAPRALTVLVVDDSVTVRKVTSRLLERQGMEVMLAKDGVEAVALLQERKPDVMLLDIEMPRMDGFEVLRHVRHDANLADLPVIMISSRTGAKHKDRAAQLGVSHFLGKPFQEAELLAVIDKFPK